MLSSHTQSSGYDPNDPIGVATTLQKKRRSARNRIVMGADSEKAMFKKPIEEAKDASDSVFNGGMFSEILKGQPQATADSAYTQNDPHPLHHKQSETPVPNTFEITLGAPMHCSFVNPDLP